MTPIQVVGVGLEGRSGLPQPLLSLIDQASLLVGSPRQLSYFPEVNAQTWPLQDLGEAMAALQRWLAQPNPGLVVILAYAGLSAIPPAVRQAAADGRHSRRSRG